MKKIRICCPKQLCMAYCVNMLLAHTTETDLTRVTNILGLNIHKYSKKEVFLFIEQKMCSNSFSWIATVNPELCLHALHNQELKSLINSANISLCDGAGTCIASRFFGEPMPQRICGSDIVPYLCTQAEKQHASIMFIGSTHDVEQKLHRYLKKQYPHLVWYTDSTIEKNNPSSYDKTVEYINTLRPNIVCVALGAPFQEQFIVNYLQSVPSIRVAIGIGGALDMLVGKRPRAPWIVRIIGCEWLWRVSIEPQRIKRILNAVVVFPWTCLWYYTRMRLCYRKNVLACIRNNKGEILLIERSDAHGHWQLPQGGIEKHESIEQAFYREMQEELGLNNFSIQKTIPNFFYYIWPKWHQLNRGYRGQRQSLVIATINEKEYISLDPSEAQNSAWVACDGLLSLLHPVRQKMGKKLLTMIIENTV